MYIGLVVYTRLCNVTRCAVVSDAAISLCKCVRGKNMCSFGGIIDIVVKTFPIHSGVGISDVCKEAKVDFLLSQSWPCAK